MIIISYVRQALEMLVNFCQTAELYNSSGTVITVFGLITFGMIMLLCYCLLHIILKAVKG